MNTTPRPYGGRRPWPLFGLASLTLHALFGALFAGLFGSLASLPPPPTPARDAVAVTLVRAPKAAAPAAATPAPTPTRLSPRERGPATGNLRNTRTAPRDGTGAREGSPGPVGPKDTSLTQTGGGGGSPAPSKDLTGNGGAKGTVRPIEDVLFSGGGRGGADLPKVAPRAGGGAGNTPVPTEATPRLDLPAPEPAPLLPDTVRAPVAGAGNVRDGSAGVGFRPGEGIGTAPRGPVARGTLRSAPDGDGIGAAADGRNTGTRSPGGGVGDGSTLPGTGGQGAGYGRGNGSGFGDGRGSGGGGEGGQGGRGALFGVGDGGPGGPLHVVYVIDVSLSMEDRNKIGAAQSALQGALAQLTPADSFNIVPFDGEAHPLWQGMRPATPEHVAEATAFVAGLKLGEGTNLGAGLQFALAAEPLNQVYVLSDGHPTVGITDDRKLWESARRWNARGAKITAIGIGFGQAFEGTKLLERIAKESQGAFSFIDLRRKPR